MTTTTPKTTTPPPEKEEALAELGRRYHLPLPLVQLRAFDLRGQAPDYAAEAGAGGDGWTVEAERTWQLHAACNFSLNVAPGLPLEDVLAALDALRARLVAQPGLLSSDWTAPLAQPGERPRLALVPAAPKGE